ncbi:MAG: Mov34/MPN/PAD-1 family protein [Novosphingobium sp.]|nr:Mov34/MPN/PAD-1 family protein [Novosphingobium sp.]
MGSDLIVTRAVLEAVREAAASAAPEEACGLLLGVNGVVNDACRCGNMASDPRRYFELDPVALIAAHRAARRGAAQIIGYFHSHPTGVAEPSAEDQRQASGDGKVWAITAQGEVRFWRDGPQGFVALSYALSDG